MNLVKLGVDGMGWQIENWEKVSRGILDEIFEVGVSGFDWGGGEILEVRMLASPGNNKKLLDWKDVCLEVV